MAASVRSECFPMPNVRFLPVQTFASPTIPDFRAPQSAVARNSSEYSVGCTEESWKDLSRLLQLHAACVLRNAPAARSLDVNGHSNASELHDAEVDRIRRG